MHCNAQWERENAFVVEISFDDVVFTIKPVPIALKLASFLQLIRLVF